MRQITLELEAELYIVPTWLIFRRERGEIEYKQYRDGGESMKLRLQHLPVPRDSRVEFRIDGTKWVELPLEGRGLYVKWGSEDGIPLPKLAAGQTVEVWQGGKCVLRGKFRYD